MTNTQNPIGVPEPGPVNVYSVGEFRKNLADLMDRVKYRNEVFYVRNENRKEEAHTALVPVALLRELQALRTQDGEGDAHQLRKPFQNRSAEQTEPLAANLNALVDGKAPTEVTDDYASAPLKSEAGIRESAAEELHAITSSSVTMMRPLLRTLLGIQAAP
ncbi:hypothetical protein AB0O47_40035, partial [Streptomyces noursei]|uniref:hypothetical protein n=1 Tax=Streptomyces noursei TaxID=1971 RepID=UPI00344C575A